MLLSELGGKIIKVEMSDKGEPERFATQLTDEREFFVSIPRSEPREEKRHPEPQERKGPGDGPDTGGAKADIPVEDFATGGMEKLTLGYEELIKINPQLIYASISASDIPALGV